MQYKKIITSVHFNRPNYTCRCISHLESCLGIEDYLIIFLIEKSDYIPVIQRIINKSQLNKIIIINDKKLGCYQNANKIIKLAFGYDDSKYIIHVEDDVILSIDALRMFEYCAEEFFNNKQVVCVNAWNSRLHLPDKQELYQLAFRKYSSFLGTAFWKHKFPNEWLDQPRRLEGSDLLLTTIMKKYNMRAVYPMVGRSEHIGLNGGLHIDVHKGKLGKNHPGTIYWADNLITHNNGQFSYKKV